jgi:hypothetical protein
VPTLSQVALTTLGVATAWEIGWWLRRRHERARVYALASARAHVLGRPLVVVGAPDRGVTAGYPCGDVTVDLAPSSCPHAIQADITKRLPFADNSCAIFVSAVLEYVGDYAGAVRELERVSGGELFVVRVEPWTFSAYLYPGTKRQIYAADMRAIGAEPFVEPKALLP